MHPVLSKLFPQAPNARTKNDHRNLSMNTAPASGDYRGPHSFHVPSRNPHEDIVEMLRNNPYLRKGTQFPMMLSQPIENNFHQMRKEYRAAGDIKHPKKTSNNKKSRQSRENTTHSQRPKIECSRSIQKDPVVVPSVEEEPEVKTPICEKPITTPTKTVVSSTRVQNGATIVSVRDEKGHMHVRVEYGRESIMKTAQSPFALLAPANMKKIVMETPEIISRFPKLHGPRSMVASAHVNCVHPPIAA